jgi:MFS family permease
MQPVSGRMLAGISVFWIGLSFLSDGLSVLILPSLIAEAVAEDRQASVLGLVSFVGLLTGMLTQPPAGAASDRLRHRWRRTDVIACGAVAAVVGSVFLGMTTSVLGILVAFAFVNVSVAVAQAAQQALIPDLVPTARRGAAAGWKGAMDLMGSMLAFIVLGQLLRQEDRGLSMALLTAAVAVGGTYLVAAILFREPAALTSSRPASVAARSVLQVYRLERSKHADFLRIVVSRFLFLLATFTISRFFVYYVAQRLDLRTGEAAGRAGLILGCLALLTAVSAPVAGWAVDRFGRVLLMRSGAILSVLGAIGLAAAQSTLHLLAAGSVMALGSAAFTTANWALAVDLAPPAEGGRFLGLANIGSAGAAAGAGLFGPLTDLVNNARPGFGYTALLLECAALFAASGLLITAGTRGRQLIDRQDS